MVGPYSSAINLHRQGVGDKQLILRKIGQSAYDLICYRVESFEHIVRHTEEGVEYGLHSGERPAPDVLTHLSFSHGSKTHETLCAEQLKSHTNLPPEFSWYYVCALLMRL